MFSSAVLREGMMVLYISTDDEALRLNLPCQRKVLVFYPVPSCCVERWPSTITMPVRWPRC